MKKLYPPHNIFAAVAYGDVFDYPLTQEELIRWSIGRTRCYTTFDGVVKKGVYFFLAGRDRIISLRKKKELIAQKKWKRVAAVASIFQSIPTVMLVGVTGGLAMNNVKISDDIDIFFITRSGTLWASRMMVTLLAEILHLRRKPSDHKVQDKMCLNMFMSEDSLSLPHQERDLFLAHEVLQMVPLWDKGGVYRKFLKANSWVQHYLPYAWREKNRHWSKRINHSENERYVSNVCILGCRLVEPIVKYLQLWYMKKRRTNEVIRHGMIRFHPRDARRWVREKLAMRLKRKNIPLDKIFYQP